VLRANQIFRAVYAEPGPHVIAFYYRQQGLLAGLLISALTLVALLGVWLWDSPSRRGTTQAWGRRPVV